LDSFGGNRNWEFGIKLVFSALTGCAKLSFFPPPMKIPIPRSTDSTARHGAEFRLLQPWQDKPDAALCPTDVRLAWTPEALLVEADLADNDVTTRATADNQWMWELGDVFEVFMQIGERRDYVELHVTPNNKRMHLRLPGVRGKASEDAVPVPFAELLVCPVGFESTSAPVPNGWRVTMSIPSSVFRVTSLESGITLHVSFCRYDASATGDPVLSTTANHPVIDFHRPHEWTAVTLVG